MIKGKMLGVVGGFGLYLVEFSGSVCVGWGVVGVRLVSFVG